MTSPTSERPATYSQVLAEPVFRVLLGTRSLAVAAMTLRTVALSMVVFAASGSAFMAALTFGIAFLPQAFGGLFLGALADRIRSRRLIAGGYALESAVAAVLGVFAPPTWVSLTLVALIGCLTPIFMGASNRLIADVLTGDVYVVGRSLSNTASSAAQLLGFATAGLAVSSLGGHNALLVGAACHLVSCLVVALRLPDMPVPANATSSLLRTTLSGNRELFTRPAVRHMMFAQWLPPTFVTGAESLVIVYAVERDFPLGSAGILLACVPVGMLIGNLVVGRLCAPTTRERLVPALVVVLGLPLVVLLADLPLVAVALLLALAGCGFSYGLGIQRAFLEAVPVPVRGQAFGLLSTGLQTFQGIGPALLGLLAEGLSASFAMATAGGATIVTAVWIWSTIHRRETASTKQ